MHVTRWVIGALLGAAIVAPTQAASQRTFVSTQGVDNSTCSLVAPCRSFAAAITATNAGGEVIVLDSGGYGAVTITSAVSIISPPGVYAGITSSGDAITIDAPGLNVVVRNLSITTSGRGVFITPAATGSVVEIYSLAISGGGAQGIRQEADSRVYIRDTRISGMSDCYSANTLSGTAKMTIEHSTAESCYQGYFTSSNAQLVIHDSSAFGRGTTGFSYAGFIAQGSTIAPGYLACDRCVATNNLFGIVGTPYGGGSPSSCVSRIPCCSRTTVAWESTAAVPSCRLETIGIAPTTGPTTETAISRRPLRRISRLQARRQGRGGSHRLAPPRPRYGAFQECRVPLPRRRARQRFSAPIMFDGSDPPQPH